METAISQGFADDGHVQSLLTQKIQQVRGGIFRDLKDIPRLLLETAQQLCGGVACQCAGHDPQTHGDGSACTPGAEDIGGESDLFKGF